MRRYHTHSDQKVKATFENLIAYRSKSKQVANRVKGIYQNKKQYENDNCPIVGIKLRTRTQSPNNSSMNLKIKIPIKSRTPNSKSPACNSVRQKVTKIYQPQVQTARVPKIEEFKRKPTDSKIIFKLNNTQKFFKKQRERPLKTDSNNLSETLKMVWQFRPPKNRNKNPTTQFRMIKSIAKSQAGEIIQAVSNKIGLVAAIKTFKKKQLKLQFLIDQIKIHMFCNHPNILKAYGYHVGRDEVYLVMQVGHSNLYDKIVKDAPIEENIVADYIEQVASGVAYLHGLGVMHRDIKPENIIMLGGCLKICDFGWSIRTTKPRRTLCGTLDYLSPEVSNRQYYNNKIDCWSIGVLMYEMLTGMPPFPDQKQSTCSFETLRLPKRISEGAKDLLISLLEMDPINRLSARQILKHPWIRQHKELKEQKDKIIYKELKAGFKQIWNEP